jgi:hypothetical protein
MSLSLPTDPDGWIAKDPSILLDRHTCASPKNSTDRDFPGTEEEQAKKIEEWIDAHINFAKMVQWVEPLIVSVFGSADAQSVCDSGYYTEGSFRTMATGTTNFTSRNMTSSDRGRKMTRGMPALYAIF